MSLILSKPIRKLLLCFLCFVLSSCNPVILVGAAVVGVITVNKQDRSVGEVIDDIKIATNIRASLMYYKNKAKFANVSVQVNQGSVLYTGSVDTQEDIMDAVEIAWDQSGVLEVINELVIDKDSNKLDLRQLSQDLFLATQVKLKIIPLKEAKYFNYTVVTFKGVVHIFGIANSETEIENVAEAASTVMGVEKVISHVKCLKPFDIQTEKTMSPT